MFLLEVNDMKNMFSSMDNKCLHINVQIKYVSFIYIDYGEVIN